MLGYRPEELVGKSAFDYIHPEDLERVLSVFAEALAQPGVNRRVEFRFRHADGSWRHLESIGSSLLDDPSVGGVIVNSRDVTERKEAEEALHRSEAGLAEAQRMANLGNWEWDVRTGEVFWSEEVFRIYGYQPSEIVPTLKRLIELVHPDDRRQLREAIDGALYRDEPYDFEHRIVRPNGEERIVHRRAEVVRGEGGEPLKMVGTVQDITGRKQTERALGESEQRFRQLFEQSVDALFVHDEQGRFVDCNSQACRLLGYSRQELLSLSVSDISSNLITEEERALREREGGTLWQRALAGTPGTFALSHEEVNRRKDGTTFPVEVHVGSVDYGGRRMVLASIHDITERKRTEEALQESHRRIRNIIESITEGFFAVDRQWRYTYINERALGNIQRAQGEELTREDLLGKNVWELFPETVGSVFDRKYHEAMREQKTIQFEAHSPLTDMWFGVHVYPTEEGLAVYSRDITDRKRTEKEIERRTHQQAVVAELGRQALAETDLLALMDQAVSLVAQTLDVEYCKILELLPEGDELLLRAGVGWEEGLVGRATEGTGLDSQAGFTLLSGEPVIVEDLREEERFSASALLQDHGAVSGMSVIILKREQPFGILGVHTKSRRAFTGDDVNFLQAVANVLAAAIERM